ncbi:hypothetical protein HPB50_026502 [Hyalomma asiaticum]|uniref:Uncharacterized protein n=1 Tax=Hyalomma asiaticum TaxID=266040 RepID=A0ACB7SQ43_HYAAI|nr:hypothetical protein HPB50_026502 [Hyalomma asiaticum]
MEQAFKMILVYLPITCTQWDDIRVSTSSCQRAERRVLAETIHLALNVRAARVRDADRGRSCNGAVRPCGFGGCLGGRSSNIGGGRSFEKVELTRFRFGSAAQPERSADENDGGGAVAAARMLARCLPIRRVTRARDPVKNVRAPVAFFCALVSELLPESQREH